MGNFAGRNFFVSWWEFDQEWFRPSQPSLKLKTTLCKYWAPTKIKISITCVSNGYSEKWNFYWVITWKLLFSGENKNLVGKSLLEGVFFMVGGRVNFQLVRGISLIPPHQLGKPLHVLSQNILYYKLYIIINCITSMVNQQLVSYNESNIQKILHRFFIDK